MNLRDEAYKIATDSKNTRKNQVIARWREAITKAAKEGQLSLRRNGVLDEFEKKVLEDEGLTITSDSDQRHNEEWFTISWEYGRATASDYYNK